MKVRPRKGRSPWAEKRLRQLTAEREREDQLIAQKKKLTSSLKKRASMRSWEWKKNEAKYTSRFGSKETFTEFYNAVYDEAISKGQNIRLANLSARRAARRAIMTKDELQIERRKKDFKDVHISSLLRGTQGRKRWSYSAMHFLRHDSIDGVDYEVYYLNDEQELWIPVSPKDDIQSFTKFVGQTPEDKAESQKETEDILSEIEQETFIKPTQQVQDDDLQKEIADTFTFDEKATAQQQTQTNLFGDATPPNIPPVGLPNSPSGASSSGLLAIRKMSQAKDNTMTDFDESNPLGILAAVKPVKKRKRRKKK